MRDCMGAAGLRACVRDNRHTTEHGVGLGLMSRAVHAFWVIFLLFYTLFWRDIYKLEHNVEDKADKRINQSKNDYGQWLRMNWVSKWIIDAGCQTMQAAAAVQP